MGQQGKNARELAVEQINAAGGIKSLGGAKLEMLYADSESKPEKRRGRGRASDQHGKSQRAHRLLEFSRNPARHRRGRAVRHSVYRAGFRERQDHRERGFKNVFRIAAKDSWWTRDQFQFLKDMMDEFGEKVETVAFCV